MTYGNEVKPKTKSDLRRRIVTSVAVLSLIIPFIVLASLPMVSWKGYDIFFASMLTAVLGYTIFEATNSAVNIKSRRNEFWTLFALAIPLAGVFGWFAIGRASGLDISPVAAIAVLFITMLIGLLITAVTDINYRSVVSVFMISILVTVFFGVIVYAAEMLYWNILLWPIVVAASADIFAYFGGKQFGKTHPFPNISPNKTTEGLMIGVLMGFVVGLAWYFSAIALPTQYGVSHGTEILFQEVPISFGFLFALLPAVIGPAGDLYFSKAKRSLGVKDFSDLLPGHGGVLDRIDSHVFATSISLILMMIVIVL